MAESKGIQPTTEGKIALEQEAAANFLDKLKAKAQEQGLDLDKNFIISIGQETVYRGAIGKASLERMTPEKVDTLNRALSEPKSVKDSVRIMYNGKKAFHVLDGNKIEDKLGLSEAQTQTQTLAQKNSSKIELENPRARANNSEEIDQKLEEFRQEVAKQINPLASRLGSLRGEYDYTTLKTGEQLSNQEDEISKLKEQIAQQQIAIDNQQVTIKQLQQDLKKISVSASPRVQSPNLGKWLDSTTASVKTTARGLGERLSLAVNNVVEQARTHIANKASELKSTVHQATEKARVQVSDKVSEAKSQVTQKVDDVRLSLTDKVNEAKTQVTQKVDNVRSTLADKVNEVKTQATQTVDKAKEITVSAAVNQMLDWVGERHQDGSRTFESDSLRIISKNGAVSIKTTGDRVILAEGKVTAEATPEDLEKLDKIQQKVEQIAQTQLLTQSQAKSQSLQR